MNEELKVVGRINVDNPSDPNNHMPARKSDEQVLAEAVNGCFHENGGWSAIDIDKSGAGDLSIASYRCVKCGRSYQQRDNPTFTDSAELWDLLMYMMGRGDWRGFYQFAWDQYVLSNRNWIASGGLPWLLTATYQDKGKEKLLFVKLCADWCREHES